MKLHLDCIPCLVRQTLDAARTLELDDAAARSLLARTLELLARLDWDDPPPVVAREIHRAIRELTRDPDPYLRRKLADTQTALELLPGIEKLVAASETPFQTAVLFSIAGNAIDLGAKSAVDANVEAAFDEALARPVDGDAVARLEKAVREAGDVLFLTDNAGEVVFDRPLLEEIGRDKVTVAVRGGPAINDATLDDAGRSGIAERFRVISNGSDTPGTWLPDCSQDFVDRFEKAELVIAKGQGNFESLSDCPRRVFFLFLTKCAAVSARLGIPPGQYVIREA
jgi:uncharacterized protein with ATP-grasp and redox domains